VAFECGFDPFVKCCIPFTLRFYIIALLFLIVDIELVLFLPIIFSDYSYLDRFSWLNKLFLVIFCGVLIVGIFHEDKEGNLEWKYTTHLNKVHGKSYLGYDKKHFRSLVSLHK
jgi:NADH:ubiquinone oxidoreductase subunit 3 (subunit A)